MTTDDIKGRVIKKIGIANELLDKGHQIIRIKTDKYDTEGKKSVFVFKASDEFEKDLEEILEYRRKEREVAFNELVEREVEARLKAREEG